MVGIPAGDLGMAKVINSPQIGESHVKGEVWISPENQPRCFAVVLVFEGINPQDDELWVKER